MYIVLGCLPAVPVPKMEEDPRGAPAVEAPPKIEEPSPKVKEPDYIS